MGFDINVFLLSGFKIPLNIAFDYNLLDRSVLDGDDWQLMDDPDCRTEVIERNVTNDTLKRFLLDHHDMGWNLYILTSTQYDFDIPNSYLFLYNEKTVCAQGSPPDYSTGVIDRVIRIEDLKFYELLPHHYLCKLLKITMPETFKWRSDLHWVVESSW